MRANFYSLVFLLIMGGVALLFFSCNNRGSKQTSTRKDSLLKVNERLTQEAENLKLQLEEKVENRRKAEKVLSLPKMPYTHAVDLGLPSGLLWADMNIGAESPEEYGDYFAWGETTGYLSGKTQFSLKTYKWSNGSWDTMTKYSGVSDDHLVELKPADDVAHINWGGNWRIPTIDECVEMQDECVLTWTTQNGVKGMRAVGPNGNSIFFPAAGCRDGSSFDDAEWDGDYWSSSVVEKQCTDAYCMRLCSVGVSTSMTERPMGLCIRPVCTK